MGAETGPEVDSCSSCSTLLAIVISLLRSKPGRRDSLGAGWPDPGASIEPCVGSKSGTLSPNRFRGWRFESWFPIVLELRRPSIDASRGARPSFLASRRDCGEGLPHFFGRSSRDPAET